MTPSQRRSYRRGHGGPKCVQCALERPYHPRLATQPHAAPTLCVLHASRAREGVAVTAERFAVRFVAALYVLAVLCAIGASDVVRGRA